MHLSVKPQKSNFYIFICALYSIMQFHEIKHIFSKCDFFFNTQSVCDQISASCVFD